MTLSDKVLNAAIVASGAALIGGVVWVFAFGGLSGESQPPESQPPASQAGLAPQDVVTQPPVAKPTAIPENRQDCEAIRGNDYLSPEERTWFLDNCTAPSAQQVPPEQEQLSPEQPIAPVAEEPLAAQPAAPPAAEPPPAAPPAEEPPATPLPKAQGPIEYAGTHSGGGSVWFRLSTVGPPMVELFVARNFCGSSSLIWSLDRIRIIGSGFEWQAPYYDHTRRVTGVFLSNGEASGSSSYHLGGCHHNVVWTASIQ